MNRVEEANCEMRDLRHMTSILNQYREMADGVLGD